MDVELGLVDSVDVELGLVDHSWVEWTWSLV